MPSPAPARPRPPRRRVRAGVLALAVTATSAALPVGLGAADGSGVPGPVPTCTTQTPPGGSQVALPIGATQPVLPYPDKHVVTTEHAAAGVVFSERDDDLPVDQRRVDPTPGASNYVQQATFFQPYRVDITRPGVRSVSLRLHDGNSAATVHRLTAYGATGQVLGVREYRDWVSRPDYNRWLDHSFTLTVELTAAPITTVVFTQSSGYTGARTVDSVALSCVDVGPDATPTPAPTPTATATPLPTPTPTPTASPTPTGPVCPVLTSAADADAWLEQSSPSANHGSDSALKVMSKAGDAAFRALVRFPLPTLPAGCVLDTAELRVYADGAKPDRTIQALRVAGPWSEGAVTWGSQPATTGAAAVTASGSTQGWRAWSVTSQVAAMYTGGNHGFLLRDAVETDDSEQVYNSREKGQSVPQLVVRTRAGSGTTPTPAPTATPTATPTPTASPTPTSSPTPAPTTSPPPSPTPTGSPTPTSTPTASTCPVLTVTSAADSWLEQSSPTATHGSDSALKVMSKSGSAAFRALVRFTLPTVPAGCVVDGAELRLYADGAKSGRTLQALRLTGAWSEGSVSWANQPGTTGTAATTTSGSTQGWRSWTVTDHVRAMYAGANHGFLVRDAVENQDSEQVYNSREKRLNVPTLVVRTRAV